MPVLSFRGDDGREVSRLLSRTTKTDGRRPPLTLGAGADSETHIHIPNATSTARVLGSSTNTWFAFVIGGAHLRVNQSPVTAVRVLRHGDRIQLNGGEMLYLDFAFQKLQPGSRLIGAECALKTCEGSKFSEGTQIIICPWCDKGYHTGCWLQAEQCYAEMDCYPVRRMLLAELRGRIQHDKMPEIDNEAARLCSASCTFTDEQGISRNRPPIKAGDEIVRCPNSECQRAYHVGCWLSFRKKCVCGVAIPDLIQRAVERREQEAK